MAVISKKNKNLPSMRRETVGRYHPHHTTLTVSFIPILTQSFSILPTLSNFTLPLIYPYSNLSYLTHLDRPTDRPTDRWTVDMIRISPPPNSPISSECTGGTPFLSQVLKSLYHATPLTYPLVHH